MRHTVIFAAGIFVGVVAAVVWATVGLVDGL
jgi:hypothetical protein